LTFLYKIFSKITEFHWHFKTTHSSLSQHNLGWSEPYPASTTATSGSASRTTVSSPSPRFFWSYRFWSTFWTRPDQARVRPPLRSRNGFAPVSFPLGDALHHVLLNQKLQVEEGDLGYWGFLEMGSIEAAWRSWSEQDQIRGLAASYIALIQWILNKDKPRCIFCNKIEENKWIQKSFRKYILLMD
jgi:hypothetical protein